MNIMKNLNEIGVIELNKNELNHTDGGALILVSIELIQWAYTEFKKGVDDGYNGK